MSTYVVSWTYRGKRIYLRAVDIFHMQCFERVLLELEDVEDLKIEKVS